MAVALMTMTLAGCGSGTTFVRTWKDPEARTVSKVAVAGLTDDAHVKKMFEEHFSADLRARGNDATGLSSLVAHNQHTPPDSVLGVLQASGYEYVFTATPLGHDTEDLFIPGRSYYIPDQTYAYWGNYYEVAFDPSRAYATTKRLVAIETSLFNVATKKLLWTGVTESEPSGKLVQDLDEWSARVIKQLAAEGLVK